MCNCFGFMFAPGGLRACASLPAICFLYMTGVLCVCVGGGYGNCLCIVMSPRGCVFFLGHDTRRTTGTMFVATMPSDCLPSLPAKGRVRFRVGNPVSGRACCKLWGFGVVHSDPHRHLDRIAFSYGLTINCWINQVDHLAEPLDRSMHIGAHKSCRVAAAAGRLVVCVNKMDSDSARFSEDRFATACRVAPWPEMEMLVT